MLIQTWQINIYPLSVELSLCMIHHQKPLMLPHNVEPGHDITVGSGGVNTVIDQHVEERATKEMRMIHHLLPNFKA